MNAAWPAAVKIRNVPLLIHPDLGKSSERDLPDRMIECLPDSIGPAGKNAGSLADGLGVAVGASEAEVDDDGETVGPTPTFPLPAGSIR